MHWCQSSKWRKACGAFAVHDFVQYVFPWGIVSQFVGDVDLFGVIVFCHLLVVVFVMVGAAADLSSVIIGVGWIS
jgi:hypothetical protein